MQNHCFESASFHNLSDPGGKTIALIVMSPILSELCCNTIVINWYICCLELCGLLENAAGLLVASFMAGWLSGFLLVGLLAGFDRQDQQEWQGAGPNS